MEVYELVDDGEVPKNASLITPHVVYKSKQRNQMIGYSIRRDPITTLYRYSTISKTSYRRQQGHLFAERPNYACHYRTSSKGMDGQPQEAVEAETFALRYSRSG